VNTRDLTAAAIALIAGAAVFGVLLVSGVVVYERLFAGSPLMLVALAVVGGAIGAYSGWLLGLIVFSALRGDAAEELRPE
jgi:hypothetical protein